MTEITKVRVVSAVALDKSQTIKLTHLLSEKLKKQVEISLEIDASIIGGLYIQFDGFILDRTVKRQLNELKESIKRGGNL